MIATLAGPGWIDWFRIQATPRHGIARVMRRGREKAIDWPAVVRPIRTCSPDAGEGGNLRGLHAGTEPAFPAPVLRAAGSSPCPRTSGGRRARAGIHR